VAQNAQSICYRRLIKTPDRISFFLRVNVRYWHKADNPTAPAFSAIGGIADITKHQHRKLFDAPYYMSRHRIIVIVG
jgi:hypothetical protein